MVKDPVCGAELDEQESADYTVFGGRVQYFCSSRCKERYDVEVDRFFQKLGIGNGENLRSL